MKRLMNGTYLMEPEDLFNPPKHCDTCNAPMFLTDETDDHRKHYCCGCGKSVFEKMDQNSREFHSDQPEQKKTEKMTVNATFYKSATDITFCPKCVPNLTFEDLTIPLSEATTFSKFTRDKINELNINGPIWCSVCGSKVLE